MQNNIGLQTAYWNGTTPELDIYKIIDLTKKANMDTIELKAGDFVPLTTEERRELKSYIKDQLQSTGPDSDRKEMFPVLTKNLMKPVSDIYVRCWISVLRWTQNSFPEFLMAYGIHARTERILPGSRRSAPQMRSKD